MAATDKLDIDLDIEDDELEEQDAPVDEEEAEVTEEPGLDEETEEEAPQKESGGGVGDLFDDIFAEEVEEDDKLKAFGDLEQLTMAEVAAEVGAVLEELKIRQGGYE